MIRDSIKKVLDQFVSGQPSLSQQVIEPRISELTEMIAKGIEAESDLISRDFLKAHLDTYHLWEKYQPDNVPRTLRGILNNISHDLAKDGNEAKKFRGLKALGEGQLRAVDDSELFEELCRRYPNFIAAFQTDISETPALYRSATDKVILAGLAAMLLSVISDPKAG